MIETDLEFRDRLQYSLQIVLAARPDLFVDVCGRAMIALPWMSPNGNVAALPLNCRRVRSEIAAFAYAEIGEILSDSDVRRICLVLEGLAWQNCRVGGSRRILDEHPLVEALYIRLRKEGSFLEASASAVLSKLEQTAKLHSLDTRSALWPKTAPALSRQLIELRSSLQTLGISLERGRYPGGARFLRLSLASDDTPVTLSQSPSALTS
ncbi:MAG: hypothetical protein ABGZ35_10855 [Planctomycetaceae bacterium]